jgi:predicted lipoprotein with Yx(FWY)xxD motif
MALSNKHVSGADGRSLYRFDEDTAIPSVSHCVGECAGKWPGLNVRRDQMVYAAGVDPQLIGCIQRADGAYQVTVGGWPLYYYANDMKADELLGQGVDNLWFAVARDGGRAI